MASTIASRLPRAQGSWGEGSMPPPTPPIVPATAIPDDERYCFPNFVRAISETYHKNFDVRQQARRILAKQYKSGYETASVTKSAMAEAAGTTGGYVVPQDFTFRLMETIAEESFIWKRANIVPMMGQEMVVPKVDVETVPSSSVSPFFGGVQLNWGQEPAPSETEPQFRALSLKAWDLLGYAKLSNQFLMDSGPIGQDYLIKLFGKAAAWHAEFAFLQGMGSGNQMPLGIINSPGLATVGRATNSQIAVADIAKMASHLTPVSWKRAIWATSPSCLAQIINISSYFLNLEAVEEANCGSLLTRPVFVTEKLAALGNAGDLLLFDPYLYIVGIRQEVLIDVSPHNLFQNYQTVFRIWLRMDGKPLNSKIITLQDTSWQVSPFVSLVAHGAGLFS